MFRRRKKEITPTGIKVKRWMISQFFDYPRKFIPTYLAVLVSIPLLAAVIYTLLPVSPRWVLIYLVSWLLGDRLAVWLWRKSNPEHRPYFLGVVDHALLLWTYLFGTKACFPDGLSVEDCDRLDRFDYFIVGRFIPAPEEFRERYAEHIVWCLRHRPQTAPEPPERPAPRYVRFLRRKDAILFKMMIS